MLKGERERERERGGGGGGDLQGNLETNAIRNVGVSTLRYYFSVPADNSQ